jgi:hypothetical protein
MITVTSSAANAFCDHAGITMTCAISSNGHLAPLRRIGEKMSAESVVHYLNRAPASDPSDESEWLLSALGQYTAAELRELLYIGEEPAFFELIRLLFALPDESRLMLQDFLASANPPAMTAAIDPDGRYILDPGPRAQHRKTPPRIAY